MLLQIRFPQDVFLVVLMIDFRIMLLHVCGIFVEQDYHLMKIHTLSMYSALSII